MDLQFELTIFLIKKKSSMTSYGKCICHTNIMGDIITLIFSIFNTPLLLFLLQKYFNLPLPAACLVLVLKTIPRHLCKTCGIRCAEENSRIANNHVFCIIDSSNSIIISEKKCWKLKRNYNMF